MRKILLPVALCAIAFTASSGNRAFAEPRICSLIECSGDLIDAGLLTKPWKQECRVSQKRSRETCIRTGGEERPLCNHVCDADSWPTEKNYKQSPGKFALLRAERRAKGVDGTRDGYRRRAMRRTILEILKSVGAVEPRSGAAFLAMAFEVNRAQRGAKIALDVTRNRFNKGLSTFESLPDMEKSEWADLSYLILMTGMTHHDHVLGIENADTRKVAGIVDDLSGQGIDVEKFKKSAINGESGGATAKFFERVARAAQAKSSADDRKAREDETAEKFASAWIALLPPSAAAGYTGPAAKLTKDIIVWDRKMFQASTDGLATVRDAIKTGKLNQDDVKAFERKFEELKKGPFTREGFTRTVKGSVENIPVVSRLADFMLRE